jgi:hypothetical protein
VKKVAHLNIIDEAHQYRIEIAGRFAGPSVHRVRELWMIAFRKPNTRKFTVDISEMAGYDTAGGKLLHELYQHGTYMSARNATALSFLNEISQPKAAGPSLVYLKPKRTGAPKPVLTTEQIRHAAAGK